MLNSFLQLNAFTFATSLTFFLFSSVYMVLEIQNAKIITDKIYKRYFAKIKSIQEKTNQKISNDKIKKELIKYSNKNIFASKD